jgi:hypothetical protein
MQAMIEQADDDFEHALREDRDGSHRARFLARIAHLHFACAAARRELQDRDTFRKLQAASGALDAAKVALELMNTG